MSRLTDGQLVRQLIDAAYDSGYYSGKKEDGEPHHKAAIARREELCRQVLGRLQVDRRPNRVVIEEDGDDVTVTADRPDDVILIWVDPYGLLYHAGYKPNIWGGPVGEPIGTLNAVKEEDIYPLVDDAQGWPEPPETW